MYADIPKDPDKRALWVMGFSDEDIDKIIEAASNAGVSPVTLGRFIYSSQEHRMINPSEGTE